MAGLASSAPPTLASPPPPFDDVEPNREEREKMGEAAATEPAVRVEDVEEDPEDADEEVEEMESCVSKREPRTRRRNESDCLRVSAKAVAVEEGVRTAAELPAAEEEVTKEEEEGEEEEDSLRWSSPLLSTAEVAEESSLSPL